MNIVKHPIDVDPKGPPGSEHKALRTVAELQRLGASARVKRLHVGDYAWAVERGSEVISVVVEQKTVPDFCASVGDDRLPRFVQETGGVVKDPNVLRAILLIGHVDRDLPTHGRPWATDQFDNILVSAQNLGVRILRCSTGQHIRRIKSFWDYTGREDVGQTLLIPTVPHVEDRYGTSDDRNKVRHLMTLPGIGEARAVELLRHFRSIDAIYAAAAEGAMSAFKPVRGVGKGLVENVNQFLREGVSSDFDTGRDSGWWV